ncbi:MAG: GAF domain-containing protein [Gammaproteobacteria bacterium]|nr:GAF domain-containing protein [Gammaproteobacteria bacterium]
MTADIQKQPNKNIIIESGSPSLWKSPLCTTIYGLGFVISLLALSGILSISFQHNAFYYINTILFVVAIYLIIILFKQVRSNFISPLNKLRHWSEEMLEDNHSARISVKQQSDFTNIFKGINVLSDRLETLTLDMQSQVRKQTKHIERKTHSLEVIYDVAASINISRDLDDLLTRFLFTLKDVVHARAAVVRLLTDDDEMRLVASIGLDDDLMEREQTIPSNECLCGIAYKDGDVHFQDNVQKCNKIIGREFFDDNDKDIGMIAVPLQYRGNTLGVYNLFVNNREFHNQEEIEDLLTTIGRHLGMAIDKARSEDEAHRLSLMEERNRLAHELHDSLAQTLASLRFQVRVLDETLRGGQEPDVWHELEKIENNIDEAYSELRELITHFRAPIDKRGLIPAVEHLIERFQYQTDISIFLQKEWNVLHLPASIEVQALRIIQESLNNIRKHSQAHTVRVILRSDTQGDCKILIEDDGVGIKNVPDAEVTLGDHLGLSIMHERAKRIGGTVKIESEPNEGTRILLEFGHSELPSQKSNKKPILVSPPTPNLLP